MNMTQTICEVKGILRKEDIMFRYVNNLPANDSYQIILETGNTQNILIQKVNNKIELLLTAVFGDVILARRVTDIENWCNVMKELYSFIHMVWDTDDYQRIEIGLPSDNVTEMADEYEVQDCLASYRSMEY